MLFIAGLPLLIALVWKLVDFLKAVRSAGDDNGNAAITQVIAWGSAIGALFLFRESQLGDFAIAEGLALDQMTVWTTVLVGLLSGSGASVLVDVKKAIDGSDSARQPPLVPPPASGFMAP